MSLVSSVRICGDGSSNHGRLCPHSGTCVSSRTASGHPRPTLNSLVREGKKEPAVWHQCDLACEESVRRCLPKKSVNVKLPPTPPEPMLEQAIRQRAYELYIKRGKAPGHALDDWLEAEAELVLGHSTSDSN